jgi:hypothetical protein
MFKSNRIHYPVISVGIERQFSYPGLAIIQRQSSLDTVNDVLFDSCMQKVLRLKPDFSSKD